MAAGQASVAETAETWGDYILRQERVRGEREAKGTRIREGGLPQEANCVNHGKEDAFYPRLLRASVSPW